MAWMADGKRFKHSRRVGSRVLTSYFPGPFGANGTELAADFAGSIRLDVPCFKLGSTPHAGRA